MRARPPAHPRAHGRTHINEIIPTSLLFLDPLATLAARHARSKADYGFRMAMHDLRLSLHSNSVRTAPPPYGRGAVRPLGAPPSLRAAPAPPRRVAPAGRALAPRPGGGAPVAPAVPRGRPRAEGACGVRWAPSVAAGAGACCPLSRPPPCWGRVAPPFPPL